MAIRVKTIEYAFQTRNTALAAATRYDFGAITLYIPETGSRTFRSVMLMVGCRDTVTTATSATSPVLGIKLGAVAFDNLTLGNPPANSGESQMFMFQRDVTSYFQTNFGAGGSQTCQAGFQVSGVGTINISAKLIITYEYDDAATTVVKTVRIPLESNTTSLTTSLAEIGTNQIPALDTFLPETSKVYRNIFFELIYNEATTGSTNDAQLGMEVDAGTEHLTGAHESGMASSCAGVYHWDQGASPAWATNAVHAFKLRSTNVTSASRFYHVAIVLYVTYEYDASSSTVINSLVLGLPFIQLPSSTTSGDVNRESTELYIEEPGTIALVQSGALITYSPTNNISFDISLGSQTFVQYTELGAAYCGTSALTQRADSGAAGGAAFSLARGKNTLCWRVYVETAGVTPSGFDCRLILNYTSSKATSEGQHNHTTFWSVQGSQASGNGGNIVAAQWVYIPESEWFRNNFTVCMNSCYSQPNASGMPMMFGFEFEKAAGELDGAGFNSVFQAGFATDGEAGWYPMATDVLHQSTGDWDRWASDPDTARMDLEASRRARLYTNPASTLACYLMLTHHSITKAIAGTISGSGGGTVNLRAHRDSEQGELVAVGSRSGNGAYSLTWYDDVEEVYVTAREDATHAGRSDDGTAT